MRFSARPPDHCQCTFLALGLPEADRGTFVVELNILLAEYIHFSDITEKA